ncbi:hypothetical protein GHT09_004348 [Marmota monax]|uniref:Uncharacterized protein n=1 Tax=Marmota monax TaxID=9995 RepID=A0A834QU16_MARMO|nr:hypothetical protein GHT09_004348 [Marmota monax]
MLTFLFMVREEMAVSQVTGHWRYCTPSPCCGTCWRWWPSSSPADPRHPERVQLDRGPGDGGSGESVLWKAIGPCFMQQRQTQQPPVVLRVLMAELLVNVLVSVSSTITEASVRTPAVATSPGGTASATASPEAPASRATTQGQDQETNTQLARTSNFNGLKLDPADAEKPRSDGAVNGKTSEWQSHQRT